MSNDFIAIDVTGIAELQAKLSQLPGAVADAAVEDLNSYFINVLQEYPPYHYVSVAQAGGWASERQRRFVMAKIRSGEIKIPYPRTQTLRRGWRRLGSGAQQIIVNEVPYAKYVMDIASQSRMMFLRDWPVIQQIATDRASRIAQVIDGSIKRAIRKLGL